MLLFLLLWLFFDYGTAHEMISVRSGIVFNCATGECIVGDGVEVLKYARDNTKCVCVRESPPQYMENDGTWDCVGIHANYVCNRVHGMEVKNLLTNRCSCTCPDNWTGRICQFDPSDALYPSVINTNTTTYDRHSYGVCTRLASGRIDPNFCTPMQSELVFDPVNRICTCKCKDNGAGRYCQVTVDVDGTWDCSRDSSPSDPVCNTQGGGRKVTVGSRCHCICGSGWTGPVCDQRWDDSQPVITGNGWPCRVLVSEQYTPNYCRPDYGTLTFVALSGNRGICDCSCGVGLAKPFCNAWNCITPIGGTCSGRGTCDPVNGCICTSKFKTKWVGPLCSVPVLCNPRGTKEGKCGDDWRFGRDKFGTSVINCLTTQCVCEIGNTGPYCLPTHEDSATCNAKIVNGSAYCACPSGENSVECSGGRCDEYGECVECPDRYAVPSEGCCPMAYTSALPSATLQVCGGRGTCHSGVCQCTNNALSGKYCCPTCGARGVCGIRGECECITGYTGRQCEINYRCPISASMECSGRGVCVPQTDLRPELNRLRFDAITPPTLGMPPTVRSVGAYELNRLVLKGIFDADPANPQFAKSAQFWSTASADPVAVLTAVSDFSQITRLRFMNLAEVVSLVSQMFPRLFVGRASGTTEFMRSVATALQSINKNDRVFALSALITYEQYIDWDSTTAAATYPPADWRCSCANIAGGLDCSGRCLIGRDGQICSGWDNGAMRGTCRTSINQCVCAHGHIGNACQFPVVGQCIESLENNDKLALCSDHGECVRTTKNTGGLSGEQLRGRTVILRGTQGYNIQYNGIILTQTLNAAAWEEWTLDTRGFGNTTRFLLSNIAHDIRISSTDDGKTVFATKNRGGWEEWDVNAILNDERYYIRSHAHRLFLSQLFNGTLQLSVTPYPWSIFMIASQCQCQPKWSGKYCDISICSNTATECNNKGVCNNDGNCTCDIESALASSTTSTSRPFFPVGRACSVDGSLQCLEFKRQLTIGQWVECGNLAFSARRGTCRVQSSPACECEEGYSGRFCNITLCPPCNERQMCDEETGKCECLPLWRPPLSSCTNFTMASRCGNGFTLDGETCVCNEQWKINPTTGLCTVAICPPAVAYIDGIRPCMTGDPPCTPPTVTTNCCGEKCTRCNIVNNTPKCLCESQFNESGGICYPICHGGQTFLQNRVVRCDCRDIPKAVNEFFDPLTCERIICLNGAIALTNRCQSPCPSPFEGPLCGNANCGHGVFNVTSRGCDCSPPYTQLSPTSTCDIQTSSSSSSSSSIPSLPSSSSTATHHLSSSSSSSSSSIPHPPSSSSSTATIHPPSSSSSSTGTHPLSSSSSSSTSMIVVAAAQRTETHTTTTTILTLILFTCTMQSW
jgi:hypothetical protein